MQKKVLLLEHEKVENSYLSLPKDAFRAENLAEDLLYYVNFKNLATTINTILADQSV